MGWGYGAFIALWFIVYWQLPQFSDWAASHLPVVPGSHLDEAAKFFVYDTPKVLMLRPCWARASPSALSSPS